MAKQAADRKTPVRHFNPRLIRKGYVYTAKDIAEIYDISESVVHRWVREEGLISIDDKKPAMFHFETVKQFLAHKKQARKMDVGNAGDLPCFKCFLKRRAHNDQILVQKTNEKFWNIQGICSCCGSKMNMRTQANEFLITITWGYQQVETLPKFSIEGTTNSSVRITGRRGRVKTKFQYDGQLNFNSDNERIKHQYYSRVLYRFGKDQKTLTKIVASIWLFEESNQFKDFKTFAYEDAKAFQQFLLKKYQNSPQMAHRTITCVREFFAWLKDQAGYKKISDDDIQALRLPMKEREKARASKPKDYLDVEKWQALILSLDPKTDIELRGRAMLACLLLTGMRVDALISLQLGDVNLEHGYIYQDPNHVKTKFSSALDKFYQFSIECMMFLSGINFNSVLLMFRQGVGIRGLKRSGEQRGGFLVAYMSYFSLNPKDNMEQLNKVVLSDSLTNFRNKIIHDGFIPNKEKTLAYGQRVFDIISGLISAFIKRDKKRVIDFHSKTVMNFRSKAEEVTEKLELKESAIVGSS